jgi:hypothetical protein
LESRDKAFIRFLSANGIPAADIVNLSSWGLTTVDRAIADNYGIAMPGAAVVGHLCPEFYARLQEARIISFKFSFLTPV